MKMSSSFIASRRYIYHLKMKFLGSNISLFIHQMPCGMTFLNMYELPQ